MSTKFVPVPTPETRTYWDKARAGELWLPRCADTGQVFFPPRAFSPFTGGAVDWVQASGKASLASYVIVHRAAPGYEGEVPYVVAMVALEEGPHLLSNLPGAVPDPAHLPLGAALELGFEHRGDFALPQFRLAQAAT